MQDDETEKLRGVMSLIKYATLCQYMLVPTEEVDLWDNAAQFPEDIPQYGARGCAPRLPFSCLLYTSPSPRDA